MPQNTSCLLALALAVSSALVSIPSQAQTATETSSNITASSQTSVNSKSTISKLKKSKAVNQNKVTNIAQSGASENIKKSPRERNWLHSRIGWLKQ
ncbi:MAG: hypothetical protein AAF063_18785 [Cyanobacteria bacterium J06643_5]